jgi:Ser-tRNA(Ala) deacylase AlaX
MNAGYLEDCYIRESETIVESVKDDTFVVLDKTIFYPNSGGQPHDTGKFVRDTEEFSVVYAAKLGDAISHEVSQPGLRPGDKITAVIDWDRRYLFMKYHTASHILAATIHTETGAQISGNQINMDKTRVDFSLEDFDRELIQSYETKVNEIIDQKLPVSIDIMPRDEAFQIPSVVKLKDAFPPDIHKIRVITIPGVDRQACGGTHVANTGEIPHIEIFKAENKGKNNRRVYFRFRDE